MDDDRQAVSLEDFEHAKENIIPLPQGRSAKMLADIYGAKKSVDSTAGSSSAKTDLAAASTSLASTVSTSHPTSTGSKAATTAHPQDESERNTLERAIATTSIDADDPLDPHHRLLTWFQERFPSGHSDYPAALERAVRTFRKDPRYKEDPRYIRMWLQVASRAKVPDDVFKYLSVNNIGQGSALYYEDYAAYMETRNRYKEADDIYKLGISRNVVPLSRLTRRYEAFQNRMITAKCEPEDQQQTTTDQPKRKALASSQRSTSSVPSASSRTASSQSAAPRPAEPSIPAAVKPQSRNSTGKIAVFRDGGDSKSTTGVLPTKSSSNAWPELGTETHSRKENTVEPTRWKDATVPQQVPAKVPARKIEVFKDETYQPSERKKALESDIGSVLATKEHKVTDIGFNSLQAVEDPIASRKPEPSVEPSVPRKLEPTVLTASTIPIPTIKRPVPAAKENLKCMLDLIYSESSEFSFEELRARHRKHAVPQVTTEVPTATEVKPTYLTNAEEESELLKEASNTVHADSRVPLKEGYSVKVEAPTKMGPVEDDKSPFQATTTALKPQHLATQHASNPTPQRVEPFQSSISVPVNFRDDDDEEDEEWAKKVKAKGKHMASPTINTKAALADVFEMFNTPLPQEEGNTHDAEEEDEQIESSQMRQNVRVERKPDWYDVESDETISAKVYKAPVTKLKIGVFHDEENPPASAQPRKAERTSFVFCDEPAIQEPSKVTKSSFVFRDEPLNQEVKEKVVGNGNISMTRKPLGAKMVLDKVPSPVVDHSSPFLETSDSQNDASVKRPLSIKASSDENDRKLKQSLSESRMPSFDDMQNTQFQLNNEEDAEDEEDYQVQFPNDMSPRRTYPASQHRMTFAMQQRELMTPITEASYEGDRTMAGLSTIGSVRFGDGRSSLGGVTMTGLINTSVFRDDNGTVPAKRFSLLRGLHSDEGSDRTMGDNTISSISLEGSGYLSTSLEVSGGHESSLGLGSSSRFVESLPSVKAVSSKVIGIGKPWMSKVDNGSIEVFEEDVSAVRIVDDDEDIFGIFSKDM
ncbi:hypothetical protein HDV05_005799 [Chytridiales sp. JEL 0842]|nr:hypothetical protein HDV05_005799 [Chytridiales sp. JEL 0842]